MLENDHPELFAATDNAITGPEMLLVALAGCLTGTSPRSPSTAASSCTR